MIILNKINKELAPIHSKHVSYLKFLGLILSFNAKMVTIIGAVYFPCEYYFMIDEPSMIYPKSRGLHECF